MVNNKTTKNALFGSVVALLLCFTMLLGTTFAWFTDSVESGSNVITAGNLDIVVEYTLDGENWNDLDGAKDLFQKGLWEPGHTEVVALRITNAGSLALKYAAYMNIVNEDIGKTKDGKNIVLSEVLTASTLARQAINDDGTANVDGDNALALAFSDENGVAYQNTTTFKAGNILGHNVELLPGAAHYLIVKVDMADTVGDEANHDGVSIPAIHFGINVLAAQLSAESDSFGDDYDNGARYDDDCVYTEEEFLDAIEAGGNIKLGADIALTGEATVLTKDATIDLNGYTLSANRPYNENNDNANAVLTVSGANLTLTGNGEVNNDGYSAILLTNGAKVTIENGTYIADTSAVYVQHGELIIKDGFYQARRETSPEPDYHRTYEGNEYVCYLAGVINCSKGAYNNYRYEKTGDVAKANVDISGGTFVNEDVSNLAEGDFLQESHVVAGYKVVRTVQSNGDAWYTVVAE